MLCYECRGVNQVMQVCRAVFYCFFYAVLRSRSRKEAHQLVGTGAVTRCGSGGSGSDNGIKHAKELKKETKCSAIH
jgi:hypothetical protein